jgi:26S proteasome regulatory subunit N7
MAPFYEHLCAELRWLPDPTKLDLMRKRNDAKLAEVRAQVADAEANAGETEVRDAAQAVADHLARIGDRPGAAAAYADAESRTASSGAKADMLFAQARLAILYGEWPRVAALLAKARGVCDLGGDWEHKNRLKVYEATLAMYRRDLKRAADLLLDATATFTTGELFPYSRCVAYASATAAVALDRVSLKKRVLDSPEVLSSIHEFPDLELLVNSLHGCRYGEFFRAFVGAADFVKGDLFLAAHARHYQRELRLVAYAQFLEAYKSVTLQSMAQAFGVRPEFLDEDLAGFIVAGRLPAVIDRVSGVVATRRPSAKNALFAEAIRKGDLLLNRVQKLARVIDVE